MKRFLLCCICVFVFSSSSRAEIFSFEKNNIQFDAPAGFKPLSKEMIALKFPRVRPPQFVIGNERASTTIAYDLKASKMAPEQVEDARLALAKMLPRMVPGLKWIENKLITLSGRKWGFLEMTSYAVDTDIHNIMLFTSYQGQMLLFNFNSTKEEFETYEAALRESLKTIKVVGD